MIVSEIVLQFSSEPKIHSAMIRWFTQSRFSHVDFVLPRGDLMGARFRGGVQIRPRNYTRFINIQRCSVFTRQADSIYAWAKTKIGTPYDFKALAAFAFGITWEDPRKLFCRNFVTISAKNGGFPLLNPRVDAKHITPNDLYLSPYMVLVGPDAVPVYRI